MSQIASLAFGLVKEALGVVGRGLEYNSTRENLEAVVNDLSPLVERIEHSMNQMEIETEHVQKLKEILSKNKEALENNKINWWNCVLAPWSQWILSRELDFVERFVSIQTQAQMLQLLTQILFVLGPQGPTNSAQNNLNDTTQTWKDHVDERFPRYTVGLDGKFMQELKAMVLDGGEQVVNLYGIPGSGKTTMAKALCRDPEVKGKFKKIIFRTLGSQTQSDEAMKMLKDELSQCGEDPVLLVLDDVWPRSEDIVEINKNLRSPTASRILVTSRAQMIKVGARRLMKLLSDEDAEKLFRHLIKPSDINFDDRATRKILIKILEGCKGLPLALEFIGRKLQGKPIEAFQKMQLEWSRGDSILDSHEELLALLQNSVDGSMRECFMDLGLFPEDQKIPITSLIDMWTEVYNLNEPASLSAMLTIQELIAMNLAAEIRVRRTIGWDNMDYYYNNYFLMQHDLFREVAIHMSQQEPLEKRKRLIIDMFGNPNDPPKWWPKQPQSIAAPRILSISIDQNINPDWCNIQADATLVLVLNLKTSEYTLPEFVKDMENLKVFMVTNYGYNKTDLRNLQLLASLPSLKRIRLEHVSISGLCNMKNVIKLSLYMCDVKEAFEDSSIDFSEAMPKLEDLSIEYCKDLVKLPNKLCFILTMKNLTISSCHELINLPKEIENLENLKSLRINHCSAFEEMPDSITKLKNLSLLDISYCQKLKKLPGQIDKLQNLTKLYMAGCSSIQELPDSDMDFNKLQDVICDESVFPLWEKKAGFSKLNIKSVGMEANLGWLF